MTDRFGAIVERFAGKKFVLSFAAIATILMLTEAAITHAGPTATFADIENLLTSAIYAVAIVAAGGSLAQGIADHGKPAPKQAEPQPTKEPTE